VRDNVAHLNGHLPKEMLHRLSWAPKHRVLRGAPAVSLEAMNREYRVVFTQDLKVNHSYRSWWRQVGVKALHGDKAAAVGHSMHGFGLALDLDIGGFDSIQYDWLMFSGPLHGWTNPEWARKDGTNPEPWHWEFL
jgi:zinc D-Ala-D-Ala carboxypeptidase